MRTPVTRSPSRRKPTAWVREAICAPYCRGRTQQHHDIAGVVHLGVPVLDGADERVALQRRRDPQRLRTRQVAVARDAARAVPIDTDSPSYSATPAPM